MLSSRGEKKKELCDGFSLHQEEVTEARVAREGFIARSRFDHWFERFYDGCACALIRFKTKLRVELYRQNAKRIVLLDKI